ncbi:MAG TPA: PilZ domain-containing protein [Terriglobales bacterium]|nr:PilZ domain-containing protein [Terriglobales bacterium]
MATGLQNGSGGPDRRGCPRWRTALQVRYGDGDAQADGLGVDISETGIGFKGAQVWPVGATLELRFKPDSPVADWFRARAVVRNVNHDRMGAEFLGMGSADRMRILEMIYRDIAMRRR